jgi:hypothetical protein
MKEKQKGEAERQQSKELRIRDVSMEFSSVPQTCLQVSLKMIQEVRLFVALKVEPKAKPGQFLSANNPGVRCRASDVCK